MPRARRLQIVATTLAFVLMTPFAPSLAMAEPNTEDDAWSEYERTSMVVAEAGEAVNDIRWQKEQAEAERDELERQIAETETQLTEAQKTLRQRVSAQYRLGNVSLVDLLLGGQSFDRFLATVRNLNKGAQQDSQCIQEANDKVKRLQQQKEQLQEKLDQIEKLLEEQERRLAELSAALTEQRNVVASMDESLSQDFGEERAKEIIDMQIQAVDQMAKDAAAEHANQTALTQAVHGTDGAVADDNQPMDITGETDGAPVMQDTTDANPSDKENGDSSQATRNVMTNDDSNDATETDVETDANDETEPIVTDMTGVDEQVADETEQVADETESIANEETGTASATDDVRAKILEAAYSQIGVPYVYGASSPGEAFDCSGLTSWAYAQAGIDIPHSSAAQAEMATETSMDELQAGDLVFYIGNVGASQSGNHVAIYAGDGQVIHANGSEVVVSPLNESYTSVGSFA